MFLWILGAGLSDTHLQTCPRVRPWFASLSSVQHWAKVPPLPSAHGVLITYGASAPSMTPGGSRRPTPSLVLAAKPKMAAPFSSSYAGWPGVLMPQQLGITKFSIRVLVGLFHFLDGLNLFSLRPSSSPP